MRKKIVLLSVLAFSLCGMDRQGLRKRSSSWSPGMKVGACKYGSHSSSGLNEIEMKTELIRASKENEIQEESLFMLPSKREVCACCAGVVATLECLALSTVGCCFVSIVGLDYLVHNGYLDDEGI